MYQNKKNKKTTKYNPKFERYLENEFNPAQEWAASDEGCEYIANYIPTLDELRDLEEEVLAACYEIRINGKSVYVGQSLRTIKRLYTHAHHLATASEEYFGIKPEEIDSIDVRISTPPIFNETIRLAQETALVQALKPALQPYYNIPGMRPDTCLPRGQARRDALIKAGVIKK